MLMIKVKDNVQPLLVKREAKERNMLDHLGVVIVAGNF